MVAAAHLIEIGMLMARALRRRVANGDYSAIADYPAVVRGVTRAMALQAELASRWTEYASQHAEQAQPPTAAAGRGRGQRRRDQVKSLVEDAIKIDAGGWQMVERRLLKLDEWLEDASLDAVLAKRTTGEVAADMCRDLGITPDLGKWPQDALWPEARDAAKARERH